jgi:NADH:ubiquinone oxidoreductase subunit E
LAEYGLRLVAIFDNDPARTGTVLGSFTILPMESLQRVVRSFDVGIAIICVPKDAAQSVAGRVVSLGIKAIWNFSPTQLTVPSDVIVRHENIALGLAILSHYLKRRKREDFKSSTELRENPPQKLVDIFARYQPKRELLVQILEETQKTFGYISQESIGHLADFLNISREQVKEAAAFYPLFRTEPPARHRLALCRGETCSRKGSDELRQAIERELHITDGETTSDGRFSLEMVPCRGICAQAPNLIINDRSVSVKTSEELVSHLHAILEGSQ